MFESRKSMGHGLRCHVFVKTRGEGNELMINSRSSYYAAIYRELYVQMVNMCTTVGANEMGRREKKAENSALGRSSLGQNPAFVTTWRPTFGKRPGNVQHKSHRGASIFTKANVLSWVVRYCCEMRRIHLFNVPTHSLEDVRCCIRITLVILFLFLDILGYSVCSKRNKWI